MFNQYIKGAKTHAVYCNNSSGGETAAQYLFDLGHEKITYMGFINETIGEIQRKTAFLDTLKKHGIYHVEEVYSEYSYESGCENARKIFETSNIPSAIFCTSDLIGVGVMDVARYEFGLKIPEDISVLGFDDIPMSSWASYNLTTISQPVNDLVQNTIDVLEQVMKNKELPPQIIEIPICLKKRNTVGYSCHTEPKPT